MKSIPCICCGTPISSSFTDPVADISEANIETLSFSNGMGGRMSYGYGCQLDGEVYLIAVCMDCTKAKQADGKIIYVRNYIP